jgi:hypothetical protein
MIATAPGRDLAPCAQAWRPDRQLQCPGGPARSAVRGSARPVQSWLRHSSRGAAARSHGCMRPQCMMQKPETQETVTRTTTRRGVTPHLKHVAFSPAHAKLNVNSRSSARWRCAQSQFPALCGAGDPVGARGPAHAVDDSAVSSLILRDPSSSAASAASVMQRRIHRLGVCQISLELLDARTRFHRRDHWSKVASAARNIQSGSRAGNQPCGIDRISVCSSASLRRGSRCSGLNSRRTTFLSILVCSVKPSCLY